MTNGQDLMIKRDEAKQAYFNSKTREDQIAATKLIDELDEAILLEARKNAQ